VTAVTIITSHNHPNGRVATPWPFTGYSSARTAGVSSSPTASTSSVIS